MLLKKPIWTQKRGVMLNIVLTWDGLIHNKEVVVGIAELLLQLFGYNSDEQVV